MPAPCCWGPRIGLIERFAGCFNDGLAGDRIVPDLSTLVGQRVLGIALGYEDLVDHDQRRRDPVMAWVLGRLEARHGRCAPLAGKSMLNRLARLIHEGNFASAIGRGEGGARCAFSVFDDGVGGGLERLDRGASPRRLWRHSLGTADEAGEALLVGIARRQRDLDAGDQFGDAGGELDEGEADRIELRVAPEGVAARFVQNCTLRPALWSRALN
jgi:hypothetical protein